MRPPVGLQKRRRWWRRRARRSTAAVAEVPAPEHPVTYFYELDPTLYTATSGTFIGSLFTRFGMENIADPARSRRDRVPPTIARGGDRRRPRPDLPGRHPVLPAGSLPPWRLDPVGTPSVRWNGATSSNFPTMSPPAGDRVSSSWPTRSVRRLERHLEHVAER